MFGHSPMFWLEISADCPKTGCKERNSYGKGPVIRTGAVERLFKTYSNLYGDLSANSAYSAISRDPEYGLEFLDTYQDRLCFATDTTSKRSNSQLAQYLESCIAEGKLSRSAYEKICYKNAIRVFGLPSQ